MDLLDTGAAGLTDAIAQQRLVEYGPNEIEFRKTPGIGFEPAAPVHRPHGHYPAGHCHHNRCALCHVQPHAPGHYRDCQRCPAERDPRFCSGGQGRGRLDALRNMMVQEALVLRGTVPTQNSCELVLMIWWCWKWRPSARRPALHRNQDLHVDEFFPTGESIPVIECLPRWRAKAAGPA